MALTYVAIVHNEKEIIHEDILNIGGSTAGVIMNHDNDRAIHTRTTASNGGKFGVCEDALKKLSIAVIENTISSARFQGEEAPIRKASALAPRAREL